MKTVIEDLDKARATTTVAARWQSRPLVSAIIRALEGEALVVGGAVRDALLGLEGDDVDIATPFLPEQVSARMEAAGLKPHPTGIEHGTLTVSGHGEAVEVTTFRRDVETDGRRAVVAFTHSAREDAGRRDFTVNALYARLDGRVYDFFGGLDDLAARRVRFIGEASERIAEDYLRILRFFRFSARFGALPLDPDGLRASGAAREKLHTLSRERIRTEMMKLLGLPDPMPVLEVMFGHGFLHEIIPLPPRLSLLGRVTWQAGALGLAPSAIRALATLYLHQRGDIERLRKAFVLSRAEVALLDAISDASSMTGSSLQEMLYRFGAEATLTRLLMAERKAEERDVKTVLEWKPPHFPVTGADLIALGWKPGPGLGEQLKALETRWVASGFLQGRDELLAIAGSEKMTQE